MLSSRVIIPMLLSRVISPYYHLVLSFNIIISWYHPMLSSRQSLTMRKKIRKNRRKPNSSHIIIPCYHSTLPFSITPMITSNIIIPTKTYHVSSHVSCIIYSNVIISCYHPMLSSCVIMLSSRDITPCYHLVYHPMISRIIISYSHPMLSSSVIIPMLSSRVIIPMLSSCVIIPCYHLVISSQCYHLVLSSQCYHLVLSSHVIISCYHPNVIISCYHLM
jgi:hypothetical protein